MHGGLDSDTTTIIIPAELLELNFDMKNYIPKHKCMT